MNKSIFRKSIFWTIFIVISVIFAALSFKYFHIASPILDLKISMNKSQALEKATEICKKYNLGPKEYSQSAFFFSDTNLQNYVELDIGRKAFSDLIENKLYSPYMWQVRHFKENELNQVIIKFSPDGIPYGFIETISENEKRASLKSEEAQKVAQKFMSNEWHINLKNYYLLDKCYKVQPSNRTDHTFIYELKNKTLGQAHYRISVEVSGNKVTKLDHFIDIPEDFFKKYNQMRATNDTISSCASAAMYILYLLLGCLLSIILLFRKNLLNIKPAIITGFLLGLAQLFVQLNQIDFIWIYYDTATSANLYLFQCILNLLIKFIFWVSLYIVSIMAAESLSRIAFSNHIQFFKTFNSKNAASYTILGKTIGGYLFVSFDFILTIITYYIGSKYFGWWSPSCTLTNPNILSTHMPGLGAICQAMCAGFWEECLFRAVPISVFAILGKYFNKQKTFLTIGFILQAIIFGAAHANYPSLPGYVRVIELIIPSTTFGLIFIYFGLAPAILIHFTFDAILFSLPLFISQASGLTIQKLIVILGILSPLIIVLISRLFKKNWQEISQDQLNSSFIPKKALEIESETEQNTPELIVTNKLINSSKLLLFAGTVILLLTNKFKSDIPKIEFDRNRAIEIAKKEIKKTNYKIDQNYQVSATLGFQAKTSPEKFILNKYGIKAYQELVGKYLPIPKWIIRFARFNGNINQKTKEYYIVLNPNGTLSKYFEIVPEIETRKSLDENQARKLIQEFIKRKFDLSETDYQEISATSDKKPNRVDWCFVYKDLKNYKFNLGKAEIKVEISGDTISNFYRYINTPEDWTRNEQKQETINNIISMINTFIYFLIALFLAFEVLKLIYTGNFLLSKALISGLIFACILIFENLLYLPELFFNLDTISPIFGQILSYQISNLINIILDSILIGLFISFLLSKNNSKTISYSWTGITISISIAVITTSIITATKYLIYPASPVIPGIISLNSLNAYLPELLFIVSYISKYLKFILTDLFLINIAGFNFSFKNLLLSLISTSNIIFYTGSESLIAWLIIFTLTWLIINLIYYFVLRYDKLLLIFINTTIIILNILAHIFIGGTPGHLASGIISILLIIIIAIKLTERLKLAKEEKEIKIFTQQEI